jgi:hypothetical protein
MSSPGQKAMRAAADAKKILREAGASGDTLVSLTTDLVRRYNVVKQRLDRLTVKATNG